jgi:hypothetical protein
MTTVALHLLAGWLGVSLGVLTGALFGLRFHQDDWLGGYNSWSRRMLRLGHISFFGLAFLNFMFALTNRDGVPGVPQARLIQIGSVLLLVGAVAMPAVCFLAAWKKPLRHLFPIPVAAISGALVCTIISITKDLKTL